MPDVSLSVTGETITSATNRKGRRIMSVGRRLRLLQEFSKWGFDKKGWTPGTRELYCERASAAEIWLQEHRATSILYAAPKDFQAFLFQTAPSARNRNNVRQALIAFCSFLVDQEYVQVNNASSLPRLPEPKLLPKPISVAQSMAVVRAAKTLDREAITFCFLYAGMRMSEARLLERRAVEDGGVRIFGKGSKERIVPQHPKLMRALIHQMGSHSDARWVFPSSRYPGKPAADTTVREWIRDVGDLAGVHMLHPHQLRHTFATRLSDKEVPLEVIQDLLGHADPSTTRIYTKVHHRRYDMAIETLDFEAPVEAKG